MTDTGYVEFLYGCEDCRLPIVYRLRWVTVVEAGETIRRTVGPGLAAAMLVHDRQHVAFGPA